jgi:hypothetical protein
MGFLGRIRLIFSVLATLLIILFSDFSTLYAQEKSETLKFDQIVIHRFPEELPRAFTEQLIPENSKVIIGTEFSKTLIDSYTDGSESFLLIESNQTFEEIIAFYEKFFKEYDWKILQKNKTEKKAIYLTESSTRRTLAIVIKEDKGKRKIKLFHKRNYSL